MPQLGDGRETLLEAGRNVNKHAKDAWDGFSDFALRDNVLEVAVGLMYGLPSPSPPFTLTPLLQTTIHIPHQPADYPSQPRRRLHHRRLLFRLRHHPSSHLPHPFHKQEPRGEICRAARRQALPQKRWI